MGGTKNGAGFDVLLTLDGNMQDEQNMANRKIAILVLRPREQGNEPLRDLAGKGLLARADIRPGEVRLIRDDDPE